MSENAKLIVGLGNPGLEYEYTRHNIGWLALDCLENSIPLIWKEKFKGLYAQATVGGEKAYFLKPQTYMNLSGESVQALCQFFKVPRQNILVIHDEVDLPFGTLTLKNSGGLAGHNGLKSIAQLMGGQDFLRLRMGIGRPLHGSVSSYVLSSFSSEDEIILEDYLSGAADAIKIYLEKGFEKAASKYSKKNFKE
ncbi:MAG: aminoacyl-tRNA hydrolase [Deltaproteobacteria bacterium]|nr:MAG: aminoacyl-tRNA hydrolase [Deltaproteobacteria bacterium]